MLHQLKLQREPFNLIKSGKKTIELRLNDDKRQKIGIGDYIVFSETVSKETIKAEVIKLYRFDSFSELYQKLPLEKCGYNEEELLLAGPKDMNKYYTLEQQNLYGVLGIEIRVVTSDK